MKRQRFNGSLGISAAKDALSKRQVLLASASRLCSRYDIARSAPGPSAGAGRHRRLAGALGAYAVTSLLAMGIAHANPTGGTVVGGNASITTTAPGTMNVVQTTGKTIIDWRSFSIGSGETVNFEQPNASSVALNRVTGNDPSAIFGTLNANGIVMLVNPNGIVFGRNSHVDVGGLVATTANIANRDFMAGHYDFNHASKNPNAGIVNAGDISIKDSGLAALVAPRVRNSGTISARLGRVALGGAETFTVDLQGDGLLSFDASSAVAALPKGADGKRAQALVVNTGQISAEGGTVELSARAVKGVIDHVINTSGIIEATSVGSVDGKIVLSGGHNGSVDVAGTVDASGAAAGETGGHVVASGAAVTVARGTKVNVAGAAGGGSIALGGKGTSTVTVAAGAALNAGATHKGKGGKVTVLSSDNTTFAGTISARGGAQSGDGGSAEVSSHRDVSLTGAVDLRADAGATGTFLIDPATLEITDKSAVTNTGSVVSRGWLESQSATSNIDLEATGQITIDAMASHRINLATTAGNSFTLKSTAKGGIAFADPATTITTQGGAITLQALGIGSSLKNVGGLNSHGGAIVLDATGTISLANSIDAGAGAVVVESIVGSISDVTKGGTASLGGGSVSVSAAGGNIGSSAAAIETSTKRLSLETGGDLYVASDTKLQNLDLTIAHVLPNGSNVYRLSAPGLNFNVADGSSIAVNTITSSGTTLHLDADESLQLGNINVGGGALSVRSDTGNILGLSPQNSVTAAAVTLTAGGSTDQAGTIGGSAPINTATASLTATAGTGGVNVANTGPVSLVNVTTTGGVSVSATGKMTVGTVIAGFGVALTSVNGSIVDDGNATTTINSAVVGLQAGGAIGASGTALTTTAGSVSADAAGGGVYLATAGGANLSQIVAGNGAIAITTGGYTVAGNLVSSTDKSGNDISITSTTGDIDIGIINAGKKGDVTLAAQNGNIYGDYSAYYYGNGSLVTGNDVTLTTGSGNNIGGQFRVYTAASSITASTGNFLGIVQAGAVTLSSLAASSGSIFVEDTTGDVTVGSVSAGGGNTVQLYADKGSFLAAGPNNLIAANSIGLQGSGSIGASGAAIKTSTAQLTLQSGGNIYASNNQVLNGLYITNTHSAPGAVNKLSIASPFLTFAVTDNGSRYAMSSVIGTALGAFAFSGDEGIVAGRIRVNSNGYVQLSVSAGNIQGDQDSSDRITAGQVNLTAANGSLGTSSAHVSVNSPSLNLVTHGDLYVDDVQNFYNLSISSAHETATDVNVFQVAAPNLLFNVADSVSGYRLNTITDLQNPSVSFTGDRSITLGSVNLGPQGRFGVAVSNSNGTINDDGNDGTVVLANTVYLAGPADIGTGSDPLNIQTQTLNVVSGGGVNIDLPMPVASINNSTSLSSIYAAGSITIRAAQGDLNIGQIRANGGDVTLAADNGAITNSGYLVAGGASGEGDGAVTLTASGSVGSAGSYLAIGGGDITVAAGQGTSPNTSSIYLNVGSPATLNLSAGNAIAVSGSNDLTAEVINAGTGTVALGAVGSISGDKKTAITGSAVSLISQNSLGSGKAPLKVKTQDLTLGAGGSISVADSLTLANLAITVFAGQPANTYAITAAAGQTIGLSYGASGYGIDNLTSRSALDFSFTGDQAVQVGTVNTHGGSATVTAGSGNITNASARSLITAGTVDLIAAGGSIGTGGAGGAIKVSGTTALTLTGATDFYVKDDTALTALGLTVNNASSTAGTFKITAPGQTFTITDNGTTQYLQNIGGGGLADFSFAGNKTVELGTITVSHDATVAAIGNGNANITYDGSGTVSAQTVALTAAGDGTGGGSIGASGAGVSVAAGAVVTASTGNVYLDDTQALTALSMTVTHPTGDPAANTYAVTAPNVSAFTMSEDGGSGLLTVGSVRVSTGNLAFSLKADRAIALENLVVGTGGSVALTSTGAANGQYGTITAVDGDNNISAGSVTLSAVGYNGGVGSGGRVINVNTPVLSVSTGGDVFVADTTSGSYSGILTALTLNAFQNKPGGVYDGYAYSISAPNLTSNAIGYAGYYGLTVDNVVSSSPMSLSIGTAGQLTLTTVDVGVTGSVSLVAGGYLQANYSVTNITTGALNLGGQYVSRFYDYLGYNPITTTATSLTASVTNGGYLDVVSDRTMTLGAITAGTAYIKAASGDLLSDGASRVTATSLTLTAQAGSVGASGTPMLTDAQMLAVNDGGNVYLRNRSDLYSLSINDNHLTVSGQHVFQVAAPNLTFDVTDSGTVYDIARVSDPDGLSFSFTGDNAITLGTVDGQAGSAVSIQSTAGGITRDSGADQVTADHVTLNAGGAVGASGAPILTNALTLSVSTGADAYVKNSLALRELDFYSTQYGSTPPVYSVVAPHLTFNVADDGTNTTVNSVSDLDGGFSVDIRTYHPLVIKTINTTPSGVVALQSQSGITSFSNSEKITAAQTSVTVYGGGAAGSAAHPLYITAPLLTVLATGDVNIVTDTHIDNLNITNLTDGDGPYDYSIKTGATQIFSGTDTDITSVTDPRGGLSFNYTAYGSIGVGAINLGGTGQVTLTDYNGDIKGDAGNLIQAATLNMYTNNGGIGTGNAINTTVNQLTVQQYGGGGVNIGLQGGSANTVNTLGYINAYSDINLTNAVGDLALNTVQANGHNVTIDNTGGSIVSGAIYGATNVSLTAAGSIGNASAIYTQNYSYGGTTNLTASATTNARGAVGSVALNEAYTLNANSVTATGAVTLTAGFSMGVGTISSPNAPVILIASNGNITGKDDSNSITGSSVSLIVNNYYNGNSIGGAETPINVTTPVLTLVAPRDIYVSDTADLTDLTISRAGTNYTGGGGLGLTAANLTFDVTDNGSQTTITTLSDTSGLNLTFSAYDAIYVNQLNVTSSGNVTLASAPNYSSGAPGGIYSTGMNPLITANALTLSTSASSGGPDGIGTSGTPLSVAAKSISASTQQGDIYLTQAGSITLGNISAGGALSIIAATGDITIDNLSYGTYVSSTPSLTLTATTGSIIAARGSAGISGTGAVNLTAADGIGDAVTAIQITNANSPVSASVTGAGSIYLTTNGPLGGGLTTSAANGSTNIVANGDLYLTSLTSATDALGNDIVVSSNAGNIFVTSVTAGQNLGQIDLQANGGQVQASSASSTISAFALNIYGAYGVGTFSTPLPVGGQRIDVSSSNASSIYLSTSTQSTLALVSSSGGSISVNAGADLLLANILSGGGGITVAGGGNTLYAGNINAGGGNIVLSASDEGGRIVDDGLSITRIVGNDVSLNGALGVGKASQSIETTATSLDLFSGSAGSGIFVDDNNSAGVTLNAIAANGPIAITTAGPTYLSDVQTTQDSAGNDVSITTANGDMTVGLVAAGSGSGAVTLTATSGSILAGSFIPTLTRRFDIPASSQIRAHEVTLTAAVGIGTLGDIINGSGSPITLIVDKIDGLTTTGANGVINVAQIGSLTLGAGTVTQRGTGSAYISATGDIDAGASASVVNTGSLALVSGGTLTVPAAAIKASGTLVLSGLVDVVATGGGRKITESAPTLYFTSGASGGATALSTQARSITASLTGAGALTINNSGALQSTVLRTADGNISLTNDAGITATSIVAGGSAATIALTAKTGDLTVQTVDAGSSGTIDLTALGGSLADAGGSLVADTLNLKSRAGIGAADTPFTTDAANVSATVTGKGAIYLSTGTVALGSLSAANGDISVVSSGSISTGAATAGGTGALTLTAAKGTTVGGDLTAGSILINGNVALIGGDHIFDTSADNGAIGIAGALDGGANSLTLKAGTGDVTLTGGATGLTALFMTAGSATLSDVDTTATQTYDVSQLTLTGRFSAGGAFAANGKVTLAGATSVSSTAGDIAFGSTIDGGEDLTVSAGGAVTFNGNIAVSRLTEEAAGGITTFNGTILATGAGGIDLAGNGFVFNQAVTANGGAIALNDTDPAGAINFAPGAQVIAATGFSQTGGATLQLPIGIAVTNGPISFDTVAQLPAGLAFITTNGTITMPGLLGPSTTLTMASGSGALVIGVKDGTADQKIDVANLIVPTAGSANLYGSVQAKDGPVAASLIQSPLRGAPWFINDTPWGPADTGQRETVSRIVSTIVPNVPVPSTPGVSSLFTGAIKASGLSPQILLVYGAPNILTIQVDFLQSPTSEQVNTN